MNRNAFKQLLKRYVAGNATEEEKTLINHWYELLYNDTTASLQEDELENIEQEMWNSISKATQLKKENSTPDKKPIRTIIVQWVAAAAVLAGIAFGINSLFFTQGQSVSYQRIKVLQNLAEAVNNTSATQKVQLEDGTVITLQPAAKLAYPNHFATDKREVYLEGEAFFEVAKNPAKPFVVHSGNLLAQVLGTSFTVKPDMATNNIVIAVKTGKVAVFEDNKQVPLNKEQQKNNGTIITPNQKVVYNTSSRSFATLLVENPEPVKAETNATITAPNFEFEDAALATVFENVGKLYAIDILVENENIYQCKFTGNISSYNLYEKLALICQSTSHQYEVKGTKILITGKGCN